jgi:hypothetical protein
MLALAARVGRNPSIAYQVLDGEGVLYHEVSGQIHILNRTATLIWEHLDGQHELRAVVSGLVELSGAPSEVVERDVIATVTDLVELELAQDLEGSCAAAGELDGGE